jgi:hypothetical protein
VVDLDRMHIPLTGEVTCADAAPSKNNSIKSVW